MIACWNKSLSKNKTKKKACFHFRKRRWFVLWNNGVIDYYSSNAKEEFKGKKKTWFFIKKFWNGKKKRFNYLARRDEFVNQKRLSNQHPAIVNRQKFAQILSKGPDVFSSTSFEKNQTVLNSRFFEKKSQKVLAVQLLEILQNLKVVFPNFNAVIFPIFVLFKDLSGHTTSKSRTISLLDFEIFSIILLKNIFNSEFLEKIHKKF